MISTTHSFKLDGIASVPVTVECEVADKGIGIHLVGLADISVKESLLRTVTAMQANGYTVPGRKVIINITPADLHEGTSFDLPIAVSLIAASGQEPLPDLDKYVIAGELDLNGSLRDIPGYIQSAELAAAQGRACILPKKAARLAAAVLGDDVPVHACGSLREVIEILNGNPHETVTEEIPATQPEPGILPGGWDRLKGYAAEKRALEIAAAGGHPILLVGAPASGRTQLAKALLDILPPMSREEALEVQRIYSTTEKPLTTNGRPFRMPHYSSSIATWLGGGHGDTIRPGEVTLAHNGILCIKDYEMLPKAIKETLRGPLEDGEIKISRLRRVTTLPARFYPVVITDPCPCGYYGEGERCTCTPTQRNIFLAKLYGPVYDRLTMQCWVHTASRKSSSAAEKAETVAARVSAAREIQYRRQGKLNDELRAESLDTIAFLDCSNLLEKFFTRLNLSVRAYSQILKIARTIADLAGSESIQPEHVAEAVSYRFLDRNTTNNNEQ